MTIAEPPPADPVARHVAELERSLRGPWRLRRSMVREVRDGLHDAVAAYREGGLDHERAAALAVHDFGPVHELAPQFQEELAARQGRCTAGLIMVLFPGLMLAWDAVWRLGPGGDPAPPPLLTVVFARLMDVVSLGVGAIAVVLLAMSFHRTASPRRLSRAVGVVAVTGALTAATTAVVMSLPDASAAPVLTAVNPYVVPAYGVSAAVLVLVVWTSVRTLRVARAS